MARYPKIESALENMTGISAWLSHKAPVEARHAVNNVRVLLKDAGETLAAARRVIALLCETFKLSDGEITGNKDLDHEVARLLCRIDLWVNPPEEERADRTGDGAVPTSGEPAAGGRGGDAGHRAQPDRPG